MKKLLLVLIMIGLVVGLFVGCLPTTPIEPEPANRVIMIELYMGIGCPHCEDVEPILELLAEEYGNNQVVLVEEAVSWSEYTTPEVSERYEWYFPVLSDRGIPNILFDGLNDRIQGYSSSDPANPDAFIAEAKNIINMELAKGAKILITVDSRNSDTNTTTISGTIENVSSSILNNLEINGMIFIERKEEELKYSVTDIFDEQKVEITSLAPEESLDFSFTLEGINWEGDNVHGVIFVQAPESSIKEILQAAYVE
jgi:thiol-disulfide isomerase/thioredoxin